MSSEKKPKYYTVLFPKDVKIGDLICSDDKTQFMIIVNVDDVSFKFFVRSPHWAGGLYERNRFWGEKDCEMALIAHVWLIPS